MHRSLLSGFAPESPNPGQNHHDNIGLRIQHSGNDRYRQPGSKQPAKPIQKPAAKRSCEQHGQSRKKEHSYDKQPRVCVPEIHASIIACRFLHRYCKQSPGLQSILTLPRWKKSFIKIRTPSCRALQLPRPPGEPMIGYEEIFHPDSFGDLWNQPDNRTGSPYLDRG